MIPALAGLQSLSPYEDATFKRGLGETYDEQVRRKRAKEDETWAANPDPGGAAGLYTPRAASVFNRMQEDAANGPSGFNRQWAGFGQALSGAKVKNSPLAGLRTALG